MGTKRIVICPECGKHLSLPDSLKLKESMKGRCRKCDCSFNFTESDVIKPLSPISPLPEEAPSTPESVSAPTDSDPEIPSPVPTPSEEAPSTPESISAPTDSDPETPSQIPILAELETLDAESPFDPPEMADSSVLLSEIPPPQPSQPTNGMGWKHVVMVVCASIAITTLVLGLLYYSGAVSFVAHDSSSDSSGSSTPRTMDDKSEDSSRLDWRQGPFATSEPRQDVEISPPLDPGPTADTSEIPVVTSGQLGWAKSRWALEIPPQNRPTLDGVLLELPKSGWPSSPWTLVLPHGKHVIQLDVSEDSALHQVASGFVEFYHREAAKYVDEDGYNYSRLIEASLPSIGTFREPLLPHFWGNYFWTQDQPDAAIRYWKWSVRTAPTFAPAYLNLAYAFHEQGEATKAKHELILASRLNFQDAFGISDHLLQMRSLLGTRATSFPSGFAYRPSDYALAVESLSSQEKRAVAAIQMVGTFAHSGNTNVRAWNNVGIYLLHKANKPQLALEYFFRAASSLSAQAKTTTDKEIAKLVLSNIEAAMARVGMTEQKLYSDLSQELIQSAP